MITPTKFVLFLFYQTKPASVYIPIGKKRKVWFGKTLGFPSLTLSGRILTDKDNVRFGKILGCPSQLTMIHTPFRKNPNSG